MKVGVENVSFENGDEHPTSNELYCSNENSNNDYNDNNNNLNDNNNNNNDNNNNYDKNNNNDDLQLEKDRIQVEKKQKELPTFDVDVENPPPGPEDVTTVKRTVGLMGAVSLIIGSMIGSGIFASTAPVISHTGNPI